MKTVNKIAIVLLAAMALSWTSAVYAADNATEFGIEDDLTVLGSEGTALDPDAEVKGFTVFGRTQASYLIPVTSGNVVMNGAVQVSSGLYVTGGSTFATGAYFTGVSSFTTGPSSMYINGGADGQVMSFNGATGAMQWINPASLGAGDNLGNHVATATLNMATFNIANAGGVSASSASIATSLTVIGTSTLTGQVGMGGALDVNGDVDLNARLNVDLSATFVSSVTAKSNTQFGDAVADIHGVNMAPAADTALSVAGQSVSGDYAAKFYSGAALAAWIKKK